MKKFFALIITITVFTSGLFFPLQKAQALFGVADITINPEGVVGWLTDISFKSLDLALKAALEALKKRLLDQITDKIVQWIQGGGKPKFVEDFKGVLEDATQATIGDVAREVGLAELCSPFKLSVRVGIQEPPPFSQRVSCTLDDIVGNVSDFIGDFRKGGWIGYNEIWQPQNNIYGLWLMTNEEVAKRTEKKEEASRQEVQAGRGFISVKKCAEWTLYAQNADSTNVEELDRKATEEFPDPKPYDPSTPPEIPAYANDPTRYYNPEWKCTSERVTTPGTAIAEGIERSLYADIDYLTNTTDLTAYVGAILDAAINRLIREGVKGVQSMLPSGSTPPGSCNDLATQAARDACNEYKNKRQEAEEVANNARDEIYEQRAQLAVLTAENLRNVITLAISQNNELATITQALVACQQGRNLFCTQNPTLADINARATQLSSDLTQFESLLSAIRQIQSELNNPNLSNFERRAKQALLDQLNESLRQAQANFENQQRQIENELNRVRNELTTCQNAPAGGYVCPP